MASTPVPLQATPEPAPFPADILETWPILIRAGRFVGVALAVALVGWYVVEPALSRRVRRRNENNPTIQEAVSRYVRLFVLVVAVFAGAAAAGYTRFVGGSALVIAAATLAVGVAGQTVVGSLVSGFVLVADPEFNIGNYIEWADGEGEVRSITLRITRVHTPEGDLLTVPNTTLTGGTVARPFGRGRRRVVERVGLGYDADPGAAIDHLTAAAAGIEGVLADPGPSAYVEEFESDAVRFRVHYWIEDPRRRDVLGIRSAYARAVTERLEGTDITISPTSRLELDGRIDVADVEAEGAST